MDKIIPPFQDANLQQIEKAITEQPDNAVVRLSIQGPSQREQGVETNTVIQVNLAKTGSGEQRLQSQGITLVKEGQVVKMEEPFGGPHANLSKQFDFYGDKPVEIVKMQVPVQNRPAKEWFFIPALALLALVVLIQRRRATQPAF